MSVQNQKSNENSNAENRPLDYYKLLSDYLKRRYGRRISIDTWVGGECCVGDNVTLEEHNVRGKTLYVLYYADGSCERIVAIYDDPYVAQEVARITHAVLRLERLARRRRSRR
jgi:hypothetical protein